jgi:hypothetical protein
MNAKHAADFAILLIPTIPFHEPPPPPPPLPPSGYQFSQESKMYTVYKSYKVSIINIDISYRFCNGGIYLPYEFWLHLPTSHKKTRFCEDSAKILQCVCLKYATMPTILALLARRELNVREKIKTDSASLQSTMDNQRSV